jgi:hypothetical protein
MNDTITNNTNTIDKLLKDELSAIETYECLLETFKLPGGHFVTDSLTPMYKDHQDALLSLNTLAQPGNGTSKSSGIWGQIGNTVLTHPEFVGKKASIMELLEGEKNTEMDYMQVLENSNLSGDIRTLIEDKLLPYQQSHVRSLDRMITVLAA